MRASILGKRGGYRALSLLRYPKRLHNSAGIGMVRRECRITKLLRWQHAHKRCFHCTRGMPTSYYRRGDDAHSCPHYDRAPATSISPRDTETYHLSHMLANACTPACQCPSPARTRCKYEARCATEDVQLCSRGLCFRT